MFDLFQNDEDVKVDDNGKKQFTVSLQFIELYNEQLQARRRRRHRRPRPRRRPARPARRPDEENDRITTSH